MTCPFINLLSDPVTKFRRKKEEEQEECGGVGRDKLAKVGCRAPGGRAGRTGLAGEKEPVERASTECWGHPGTAPACGSRMWTAASSIRSRRQTCPWRKLVSSGSACLVPGASA